MSEIHYLVLIFSKKYSQTVFMIPVNKSEINQHPGYFFNHHAIVHPFYMDNVLPGIYDQLHRIVTPIRVATEFSID